MSQYFESSDLALMDEVVRLFPDLLPALIATKRTAARVGFPVMDVRALYEIFDSDQEEIDDRAFEVGDLDTYIPREFFPIVDVRDCLTKFLIALKRGSLHHQLQEVTVAASGDALVDAPTYLPGPSSVVSLSVFERYLSGGLAGDVGAE